MTVVHEAFPEWTEARAATEAEVLAATPSRTSTS